MSSERTPEPVPVEEAFLARLADVSPISESVEQVHLAAAVSAARDATAVPSRRPAARPVRSWRNPRMALGKIAAIVAGLSLPAKAFAATAVAAATIGGGVAVTSAPENPPADTPAAEALEKAAENAGFDELPARGEPGREGEPEATVEDDEVEAQEEHENNGLSDDVRAVDPHERSEVGKARAAENRAAAQERAAEARERAAAEEAEAEARQEAAQQRREEAQARRAEAQSNAGSTDGGDTSDVDTDEDDDEDNDDDTSATGSERSAGGRAKADDASGR